MSVILLSLYSTDRSYIPMSINLPSTSLPRVVIAGGGFAGLKLAQELDSSLFQIVLIDHHNYHQFPPLIYQVAKLYCLPLPCRL